MKKVYLFFVILCPVMLHAGGAPDDEGSEKIAEDSAREAESSRQRGVLFFSDESESEFSGAISKAFFFALEQKAGPILVSGCLFNAFLRASKEIDAKYAAGSLKDNPFVELVTKTPQLLQNAKDPADTTKIISDFFASGDIVARINLSVKKKQYQEIWQAMLLNRMINFDDWLVFEVDSSRLLYLLIPYDYIGKIASELVRDKSSIAKNIPKISWLLGFKLYTMLLVPTAELKLLPEKACSVGLYNASLLTFLDNIFITQQEYYQQKKTDMSPAWTLYLTGHGYPGRTVAGINLREFSRMLDFLEKNIATKLFVYDSCFAAGQNAEEIYRDLLRVGSKKIYLYPLVTAALTDASTSVSFPNFFGEHGKLIIMEKKLVPQYDLDFADFLNRALSSEVPLDFSHIVAPVIPLAERSGLHGPSKTAAQVRLPGLPWFSVVDAQNRVVSFGPVLATAYEGKKLDVLKFFMQQQEISPQKRARPAPFAILLYTTNIPFEVDLHKMFTIPQTFAAITQLICFMPAAR